MARKIKCTKYFLTFIFLFNVSVLIYIAGADMFWEVYVELTVKTTMKTNYV